MRTYRGIVCEKNKNDMVFLTHDGQFLRGIPLVKDAEVGDEVAFHLAAASPPHTAKRKPYFIMGPALIAAVLLLFLAGSLLSQSNNAYAYIKLDGENSIELGVDGDGNVISIRPLHKDTTIEVDDWKGQPLEVVLAKAVKEVSPDNELVSISTSYENLTQKELNKKIEKAVKEAQSKQSQEPSSTEENKSEDNAEGHSSIPSIEHSKESEKQSPLVEQKKEAQQIEKSSNNQAAEKKTDTNQTEKTNELQGKPKNIPAEKPISENKEPNQNNGNSNAKSEEDKMRGNSNVPFNKDENSNSIKQNNSHEYKITDN